LQGYNCVDVLRSIQNPRCILNLKEKTIDPLLYPVLLSLIAGLGTGLGGLIAIIRVPGKRSFGFLMGLTAGVMITLSFLDLVNHAWELKGFWTATLGFGAGAFFMLFIDMAIPHIRFGERENSLNGAQEVEHTEQVFMHGRHRQSRLRHRNQIHNPRLFQSGILLSVGIAIHNLPEGFAVGASYMHDPAFGVFIALAILLHNIPEGIATALPLCKSGVCKWDSFRAAFLSGMVEPVGALMAALFLSTFEGLIPAGLAFAGGVMMFITLDELIPTAREHGHQHYTAIGIILGAMFVFILSGIFDV
jgi:zinc transporter, ZIP family